MYYDLNDSLSLDWIQINWHDLLCKQMKAHLFLSLVDGNWLPQLLSVLLLSLVDGNRFPHLLPVLFLSLVDGNRFPHLLPVLLLSLVDGNRFPQLWPVLLLSLVDGNRFPQLLSVLLLSLVDGNWFWLSCLYRSREVHGYPILWHNWWSLNLLFHSWKSCKNTKHRDFFSLFVGNGKIWTRCSLSFCIQVGKVINYLLLLAKVGFRW